MSVARQILKGQTSGLIFVIACILIAMSAAFVYANFIVDREALIKECLLSDIGVTTPERCK